MNQCLTMVHITLTESAEAKIARLGRSGSPVNEVREDSVVYHEDSAVYNPIVALPTGTHVLHVIDSAGSLPGVPGSSQSQSILGQLEPVSAPISEPVSAGRSL